MGNILEDVGFNVDRVLSQLTPAEKISLLCGIDFWHTAPIDRLNVPSIRTSDGPNGVRRTRFYNGVPAACLPCGTALAATWDTKLVRAGGTLQGQEAIAKGASVLLGPTTNMQRSPLGDRGFESFSEDPFLAGAMSAATVGGIQSTGVAATIKHYVFNDQEDHRSSVDCTLSERALKEIYLMPFQIAQRDSQPACYKTGYNRVNGTHCSENGKLMDEILRKQWGFDGVIMSDWFGTYSAAESIKASLDLEMPGPPSARGEQVSKALACGKLIQADIDAPVRQVLKLVKKVEPLGIEQGAPERTVNTPATAALLRKLSSDSIVLMKNNNGILPFSKAKTTAIIGPNAAFAAYCGGGSASLLPYYAVTPLDAIRTAVPEVEYALGVPVWRVLPTMPQSTKTKDGKAGLTMRVYDRPPTVSREIMDVIHVKDFNIMLLNYKHPKLESTTYWADYDATFTPDETEIYDFGLEVAGAGKIFVDGECLVDNETKERPGGFLFGGGTEVEVGSMKLEQGKTYRIRATFGTMPTMTFRKAGAINFGAGGLRIGLARRIDRQKELERAVQLACKMDQVVLSIGLSSEWESEGFDRPHMDLPPGVDELVAAILEANFNTAIVLQSGTPVTMPWVQDAEALLQAWYGGNECGYAIADVIFGDVNPSGKLPLSFPLRDEDNPAFLNYRSERNRVYYGEGVYLGYRFYEKTKRDVAFPLGHGLSYTSFDIKDAGITDDGVELSVTATVVNTGDRAGSQVVQACVSQRNPSVNRPNKELKGFAKVLLQAGQSKQVTIRIEKECAASFWMKRGMRGIWSKTCSM